MFCHDLNMAKNLQKIKASHKRSFPIMPGRTKICFMALEIALSMPIIAAFYVDNGRNWSI